MPVNNGIVSAGVQVADDVAALLGVNNTGIGYLCSNEHGKINMWSRMKPVHRLNDEFPDRIARWWLGTLNDCGIVAKSVTFYGLIPEAMTADMLNGWYYMPPYGGDASPYRILDFDGYFHYAMPPISGWELMSEVVKGQMLTAALLHSMVPAMPVTSPGSLGLDEIQAMGTPLSEWKLGMVILDKSGNRKGRVVGDGLGACEMDISHLITGQTYKAYPFLALYSMGQMDTDIANQYVTIPYCAAKEFRIITQEESIGLSITLTGKWELGVRWDLKITTKRAVHVYAATVSLRFTTSFSTDALQMGEEQKSLGAFDINPGTGYTRFGSFVQAMNDKDYKLSLYMRTDAGIFEQEAFILTALTPGI